jgi:hypothetical protein
VLDVFVTEPSLQRPRVVAGIGKRIAAAMPQHVRVDRKRHLGPSTNPAEQRVRRCKHGSLIDISLSVSPIKNAQGKIIGAAKIARDITERKRSEAQIAILAREAEHRAKNVLATVNLSHMAVCKTNLCAIHAGQRY